MARTNEPIVVVEVVVEIVEVESPLLAVPVEVSHATITVVIEQNYAKYPPVHPPLSALGVVFYSWPLKPANTLRRVSSFSALLKILYR